MVHSTFSSTERALASDIVNWKGWAQTITDVGKNLGTDFLSIMLKGLFKPLEDQAAKTAASIGTKLAGIFGGGGGVSNPIGMGPAISAAGTSVGGGTAGAGGATSAVGGVSSLMGTVTAIAGIGSMISGIIGNFQSAKLETTMNAVEESTRYMKIGLVTQPDSLLNDSHVIRNTLTDLMAFNWHVLATYLQGMSINLDTISGKGAAGGKGGISFTNCTFNGTPQQNADAIFTSASLAGAFG